MSEYNRNYGAMTTAREFWGGNNGFVTVALNLPTNTHLPVGAAYLAAKAAHEAGKATPAQILLMSNCERNLFRIAQAIGQRAVVVAVSGVEEAITNASIVMADAANILAYASAGTPADDAVAVTFLIERADVYTRQQGKPGSTYAVNVDACQELAAMIGLPAFFESDDQEASPIGATVAGSRTQATGVKVKVFDALPVLK